VHQEQWNRLCLKQRSLDEVIAGRSGISQIDATFSVIFEKADSEIRGDGFLKISATAIWN